jgi:invasion protein IalB
MRHFSWANLGVLVGVVALSSLGLSSRVQAQTQQPKGNAAEQPQVAPAQKPTWTVNCSSSQAGMDCSAVQSLYVKRTGQRFITVAVKVPSDTKTPKMLILLPLGTNLPAGVSLQFGKAAAKSVQIQNCDQGGCLAEYPISEAEIASMLKGADLTVTIQSKEQKPMSFPVSALGFSEAYAKIK